MPRIHTIGPVQVWIYFNDTQKHRRRVAAWARSHVTQLIAEWNRCNPQMPIGKP